MSTSYEDFKKDPQLALDKAFESFSKRSYRKDTVFIHISYLGIDGKTRYGSHKYITRKDLEGRKYDLEYWDGKVGIHFTDELHDPKNPTNKFIRTR